MAQGMLEFFGKFFAYPSVWGWVLALVFGAIWLACYRPPLLRKPWLWLVIFVGFVLAPVAIAVTAFPLAFGITTVYGHFWGKQTIADWALLASLPSMYLYGLVREGFKLVPVVFYWWRMKRNIEPKLGVALGAASGAGYGIMQGQWVLNSVLAAGWSWERVQLLGIDQMAGFWETFFVIGANVGACALAGWGLSKGRGWQFYLVAAVGYVAVNYGVLLVSTKLLSLVQVEFLIAAVALLITGVVLWLRQRNGGSSASKLSGRR